MLNRYEKFLEEFDDILEKLFEQHYQYIKCKKGCSLCCSMGDYPYSWLEFSYLTKGFLTLPTSTKALVQKNIKKLLEEKEKFQKDRFEHKCPFLINDECCVYKYRGIICRTFGLCYFDDVKGYVRLPGCVYNGLNYSKVYDIENKTLNIKSIPRINLRIDKVLTSAQAKKYRLDYGQIRPMLDWIKSSK